MQDKSSYRWIDGLNDEDLAFIKRFMLASGSLKELAHAYGVSYPTVRLRLDRLIEKIKVWDSEEIAGPFERALLSLFVEGKIDRRTLEILREAHAREEDEDAHAADR
ncbi:MAG: DUF2089 family protein [Armatimonadota bacterium]